MDPKKISSFAQLLKDNGDKILNSGYKLTLSGSLLRALNDSFVFIVDQNEICPPKSFQVVKTNNSKSDAIRDLQFIHDFIQKTLILCITSFQADDTFDGIADISKFRNLQRLEIQRFYVKQITGIQQLRSQLQEISCVRKSIASVKEIISDCGGDNSNGFVWNELKVADFSCNGLTTIDCSLEFAQFLQRLNLSHNQIVSVDAIKWLPHLKVLDLSYNKLTHIPTFNIEAGRRLQVLLLSNNFVEEISGLSRLDALNELDLSGNCILDHSILFPISSLAALRYLNLVENPLAFYTKYRESVAKLLHKNTSSLKFILDNEPLTKYEKSLTGKFKSPLYQSLSSAHLMRSNTLRSMAHQNSKQITPSSSISSINSVVERDPNNLNSSIDDGNASMTNSTSTQQSRRVKVRKVQIGDIDDQECNSSDRQSEKQSVECKPLTEGNKEHLEMKKDIENLVKKYGEEWLHKEGAHLVHNVIGVQYKTGPKKRFSTDDIFNLHSAGDDIKPNSSVSVVGTGTSTSASSSNSNIKLDNKTKETLLSISPGDNLNSSEFITSTPTNGGVDHNASMISMAGTEYKSIIVDDEESRETLNSVYKSFDDGSSEASILNLYNIKDTNEYISDPEDDEEVFPVILDSSGEELFFTISSGTIREKDILTNRTRTKWPINMLESCERLKSNLIRINFDTMQKHRKQRSYRMELDLCQKLEKYLRDDILAKRPLSEMNQTLFRCANCSAQFCKENTYKKQNLDIRCIECRSTFVIEIKESPKLNFLEKLRGDLANENTTKSSSASTTMRKSASHSSIAPSTDAWRSPLKLPLSSVGSLNESSSCSKISNSESSFDSNQSVAGSSNSERDRDLDINGKDSDIEILSNPSQSSIEVLDSIFVNRKHSEERRISQIPTLDTITDDLSTTLTNQSTSTDYDNLTKKLCDDSGLIETDALTPVQVQVNPNFDVKSDKKSLLSAVANLTESSSSGSVTDSICTAYEQSHGKSVDETAVLEGKNKSDKLARTDSTISSVLNNLLQSTNILLSKSQKPNADADDDAMSQIEPYKFSYKNFNEVDHRLKLYFYQNLFEDENENFKWLVKCKIIDENSSSSSSSSSSSTTNNSNSDSNNNDLIFNGIVLVTTTKLYILKITNNNYDNNPKNWLKRYLSVTIDRLDRITVLPWKIGIELNIKLLERINVLLLDILRTDNFLLFITTNLPDTCTIIYQQSDILLKKLLKLTNNLKIEMFAILKSCDITPNSNSNINNSNSNNNNDDDSDNDNTVATAATMNTISKINLNLSSLLITDINLYLSNNFNWLVLGNGGPTNDFMPKLQQDMSNLLEYKKLSATQFLLYFYDDNTDKYENWEINFETEQCADSALNAISQSWEKIFDVPLTSN